MALDFARTTRFLHNDRERLNFKQALFLKAPVAICASWVFIPGSPFGDARWRR
jgi:hypothetical protein